MAIQAMDFRNPVTGTTTVLDSYWKKRKKRLEQMLKHYSETAWKPGGFTIEDIKQSQARFHGHSRLGGTLARRSSENEWTIKYKIIPKIEEEETKRRETGATTKPLNTSDLKSTQSTEEWNHHDLVQRRGADVKYLRKYKGQDKTVTFKNRNYEANSKVGSLDNFYHKPGGGNVRLPAQKVTFSSDAKSKVGSLHNVGHTPGGGNVRLKDQDINWKSKSKVGSLDNISHEAEGGGKAIFNQKLRWKGQAKVGSLDNINHRPERSFKTLYDYLPPLRKRLLEKEGVVWTRGINQEIVKEPYKLAPFKKLAPIRPQ